MANGEPVKDYRLSGVSLRESSHTGRPALEMRKPSLAFQNPAKEKLSDRNFMAWLPINFHDGRIDVDIAADLTPERAHSITGAVSLARFSLLFERAFPDTQKDFPVN
jgi:hypothetical protein